jgi:GMP synthase PP-ATPase subunit
VDEIYINTIREHGLYDQIWQAFAVFLPVRSVGVQVRKRHAYATAFAQSCMLATYPYQVELAIPLLPGAHPVS